MDNRRRRYPALDIRPGPGPGGLLPFYDAVLVAIDDCSPFAVQEEHDHLRVIFTDEADRATAETMLADLGDLTHTSLAWVTDDDWATRSQADLRAVRAGQVIVAPPWDLPVSPSPSEIVVEVLPALGFGSGHHACLGAAQARALLRSLIRNLADLVSEIEILETMPAIETFGALTREVGFEKLIVALKGKPTA